MSVNHKKFKTAVITLGGSTDYSCQVLSTKPTNNSPDGDKFYTFCADGAGGPFREEVDPDWNVSLKWKHDWTPSGFSRYIHDHDQEEVTLTIQFDNDVTDWDRTWTGTVKIKQPGDGGDARTPQEAEATWNYIGVPALTFADEES